MPQKITFSQITRSALLVVIIFLFFLLMSRIDYIVNVTLYDYGLRFSYDWAIGYWVTYTALFGMFGLAMGVIYWFSSPRTLKNAKLSAALALTIVLLAIGGLQDIMFFVLWSGGLPSVNVVWWWVPWISIVGTWNTLAQLWATAMAACLSGVTWFVAFKDKNRD